MKLRVAAFLLAVLLFLTGCVPDDNPAEEWDYDFGTTPENVFNGKGEYAMNDGFIYVSKVSLDAIREYDMETGKIVEYPFPKWVQTSAVEPKQKGSWSSGNLFLLSNALCYINSSITSYPYQDENGKTQWFNRDERTLNMYHLETGESTPVEELGTQVFEVIPMKKKVDPNAEQTMFADSDNPLAGIELYCFFGYDTFPEMAAQLAQDGITLEEPKDRNERNKYYVLSIGRLDGDTRQLEVLFRGAEALFVDDQYIYTMRADADSNMTLYRSSREEIDFQLVDVGIIGNQISPYNGGFYFFRMGSWQVYWYQDGEVTELPIVSCSFTRWRDQLIYNDLYWKNKNQNGRMKSYDLNTGEIRDLGVSSTYAFCIFDDRFLICEQDNIDNRVGFLLDLETGEQKELYRMEQ